MIVPGIGWGALEGITRGSVRWQTDCRAGIAHNDHVGPVRPVARDVGIRNFTFIKEVSP